MKKKHLHNNQRLAYLRCIEHGLERLKMALLEGAGLDSPEIEMRVRGLMGDFRDWEKCESEAAGGGQ
jgi:hypothetical protein